MLKTMARDFRNFAKSNPLCLLCSAIYFHIPLLFYTLVMGSNISYPLSLISGLISYFIAMAIIFSPLGEKILRFLEHIRKLETKQEKELLQPIFDEVYEQAKRRNPELGHIEMCVVDKVFANAYALGKHTVAVTKGAMQTFSEDGLKALIAHEIAHILYHDTIANIYVWLGNSTFMTWVFLVKGILSVVDFLQKEKKKSMGQFVALLVKIIFEAILFLMTFLLQAVVAINSRKNEYRADRYAYDLGYGEELVEAFYLLEKIHLGDNSTVIQRMLKSHPRITARIERLETMIDQEEAMQTAHDI